MDDNKKNGYDEKQSYYYSYGPYKSGSARDSAGDEPTTSVTPSGDRDRVEVAPPRPVRPFTFEQGPKGDWQHGKKKTSGFKSAFSAFLAGAVVVGGLMFAADKTNLFTGDGGVFATTPSSTAQASPSSAGSGNGVKNGGGYRPSQQHLGNLSEREPCSGEDRDESQQLQKQRRRREFLV